MKNVLKRPQAPEALSDFVQNNPGATWNDAHANDSYDGKTVPQICCVAAGEDQYGICAYCEKSLEDNHPRVEHFHPKSDSTGEHMFDWGNMLAVCDGNTSSTEKTKPKSARLHCDAYKNTQIESKQLKKQCYGYILNPLHLPVQHNLFTLDYKTGKLYAHDDVCAQCDIDGNKYATTKEMVEKTIEHLHLNAASLCELRKITLNYINKLRKPIQKFVDSIEKRDKQVAEHVFCKKWPPFFTTYRCILGQAAEDYLHSINYQG